MKPRLRLHTFRYGEPPKRGDGLRIGTTRLPPRGVKKVEWAKYFDVWFPLLGPSRELLARRPFAFEEYEREIDARAESRQAVQLLAHLALRTAVSVGCYCEDESHCHRTYLRRMIKLEAEKLRAG
jgi:uncharacterized protein YeaO (DUF488 family)